MMADFCEKVIKLQKLLNDMAIFCPLSSDLVECLHGFSQNLLHRWRGTKPSDPVAAERLLFALVTRSFGRFRAWLWDRIGDAEVGKRQFHYGRASSNQYTQEFRPKSKLGPKQRQHPEPSRTLNFDRMDRLLAYGQQTGPGMVPRKLCGDLPKQTWHEFCSYVMFTVELFTFILFYCYNYSYIYNLH